MAMNFDVNTNGLEPAEPSATRLVPPVEVIGRKNPYFISQVPATSITNPDVLVNFRMPDIPQQRITPPQPINLSGAGLNAPPTVTTAPLLLQTTPAPTIAVPLATIPTGYQFSFNQVRLPLSSTLAINNYKVYRSTTNSSATASAIRTIVHNPANVGQPVVVQDSRPNGVTEFFWVSAVSIAGVESTLTPAQSASVTSNAGFNSSSQLASSFHNNPLNVNFAPLSSTVLSNGGTVTAITISANTNVFGSGASVPYNSGSVDFGFFGDTIVLASDPSFSGGSVIYSVATLIQAQCNSDANLLIGKIHASLGSATTGGGQTGGTTGAAGKGGRGYIQ